MNSCCSCSRDLFFLFFRYRRYIGSEFLLSCDQNIFLQFLVQPGCSQQLTPYYFLKRSSLSFSVRGRYSPRGREPRKREPMRMRLSSTILRPALSAMMRTSCFFPSLTQILNVPLRTLMTV